MSLVAFKLNYILVFSFLEFAFRALMIIVQVDYMKVQLLFDPVNFIQD